MSHIWLLEPYLAGSHQAWAEGYARASAHQVTILSLPGRWWKWRMHGGAITLAEQANRELAAVGRPPDLLLCTDMLDLTTTLALTRHWSAGVTVALYMHENQLTYPLPETAPDDPAGRRDLHYAFNNYSSMLAADAIFFNSSYHLESWFDALPALLARFPDYRGLENVARLRRRSSVLPLGLALAQLGEPPAAPSHPNDRPLILWNHRWEYDKDPQTFFRALAELAEEQIPFRVAVCGDDFGREPAVFAQARRQLDKRVVQWGRVTRYEDYAQLLWLADLVVSTARHDFFGAAVVEAIYCHCWPLLPDRLAYPEHVPPHWWNRCLYQDYEGLLRLLRRALAELTTSAPAHTDQLRANVARYDWALMAPRYDAILAELARRPN